MKKLPFFALELRYLRYFTHHKLLLSATFSVMVGSTLLGLVSPWPMKYIVDNVIGQQPFKDPFSQWLVYCLGPNRSAQVAGFGLLMLLLTALSSLFDFAESYLETVVQSRALFRLRSDVFSHIKLVPLGFYDKMRTGELINRISKDTDRIIDGLISSMGDIITNIVKLVGLVITMLLLNWKLSLIVFAYIPFFLIAFTILRRRTKTIMRLARQEEGLLFSVAYEILANIRIVKAFGRQADEQQRFDRHGIALMDADLRAQRWEKFFDVLIDLLKASAVVLVVWEGIHQIMDQHLTVGELLIFMSYVGTFYSPLKKFSTVTAALQKATISAERISELLDTPAHVFPGGPATQNQPPTYPKLNPFNHRAKSTMQWSFMKPATAKPLARKVEFDQVSFSYQKGRNALSKVSFVAEPSQKIAIVGATGAGKSTMINLLMRFYDPVDGRLLIDGIDLRTIPVAEWTKQVALVSQEPLLFATTIHDNIAYGRPRATTSEIMQAARIAQAHDFIMQLPNQYLTVIGERGSTLSGGQRQRLTLARAVLCNAPILILDEPTSGLDTIAEHSVMEAIKQVTANRTTFICTHRLTTIRNADLILVMENGQISEQGRHEALLANQGKYAQLWTVQQESDVLTPNLVMNFAS